MNDDITFKNNKDKDDNDKDMDDLENGHLTITRRIEMARRLSLDSGTNIGSSSSCNSTLSSSVSSLLDMTDSDDDDDDDDSGGRTIPLVPRLTRLKTIVNDHVKRPTLLSPLPIRRHPNRESEEISESGNNDDGMVFGIRKKHFKAQLNLSILTFSVTAFVSISILTFAILMLALKNLSPEEFQVYTGLIAFVGGTWVPSPTTLVKDNGGQKKRK